LIEIRIVPGIGMYLRIHVKLIFNNHKSGREIVLLKLQVSEDCMLGSPVLV